MQLANCLVAIGGDRRNTVPKYMVTAAEIAVLAAIHGDDAVHEIEVLEDEVTRSHREEMDRLVRTYPAKNEDNELIVQVVYPGRSPVLHDAVADLGLPDELFAVERRSVPTAAGKKEKGKGGRKPAPVKASAPSNSADGLFDDEDDAEAPEEGADVMK